MNVGELYKVQQQPRLLGNTVPDRAAPPQVERALCQTTVAHTVFTPQGSIKSHFILDRSAP